MSHFRGGTGNVTITNMVPEAVEELCCAPDQNELYNMLTGL